MVETPCDSVQKVWLFYSLRLPIPGSPVAAAFRVWPQDTRQGPTLSEFPDLLGGPSPQD